MQVEVGQYVRELGEVLVAHRRVADLEVHLIPLELADQDAQQLPHTHTQS
jgi:hypothetical protein